MTSAFNQNRLLPLLLWRGLAAVFILLIIWWFYFPVADLEQRRLVLIIGLVFGVLSLLHYYAFRFDWPISAQLFAQFFGDIILVAVLLFATGGYQSPFVVLFGLIIVAAATQGQVLLVLSLAVLACMAYLIATYSYAWWQHIILAPEATLQLLLQTSVLLLVGGVMAVIARRHARLGDESRRVAREHRDLQALHTRLMASMQEGVLVLDRSLKLIDYNPSASVILNLQADKLLRLHELEAVPKRLLNFLHDAQATSLRCAWQREDKEYLVTAGRFPEQQGEACWWLTLVDVSELRGLERKFAQHEKLAAMGRMAAMLAHELRNPMQTIAQAVELVTEVQEKQQYEIQRIVGEEVERLNRLVSDMLDYTRPLAPNRIWVVVAELLQASKSQVDPNDEFAIQIKYSVERLYIDADHWRLVLDNLLRNACVASPARASIGIEVYEQDQQWFLCVKDHGCGIPKELQTQIFEPFSTYSEHGTGLGLATVWQVCQVNEWIIKVESDTESTCLTVSGELLAEENYG
ncbi:MAG: ATP-binding protein [Mariprofundaceae bacterium]